LLRPPATGGRRILIYGSSIPYIRDGVGVILDWVPGHLPRTLTAFPILTGALFEYATPKRRAQSWGTKVFDFGKNEVRRLSFPTPYTGSPIPYSTGLRVDAVASMLYLDYDRKPENGRRTSTAGGKIWRRGILHKLNEAVFEECPGASGSPRSPPLGHSLPCRPKARGLALASMEYGLDEHI
jgi:1,4-alpha-glucan branching enzyme